METFKIPGLGDSDLEYEDFSPSEAQLTMELVPKHETSTSVEELKEKQRQLSPILGKKANIFARFR